MCWLRGGCMAAFLPLLPPPPPLLLLMMVLLLLLLLLLLLRKAEDGASGPLVRFCEPPFP